MLRKANTTTAKRPDLSGNLPPFFVQRAAIAERIATAEKQLRDLAAQSEALLADPSTGPTLTADLSRLEGESQALGKMIASDRRRMEAMDKTEFAPAAQKLVSSLGTARAAVLAALAEAVSLRVSPWLMSGKGDLGDLETQKGDLERLVNRSHLLTDERDRQTALFAPCATVSEWLHLLPVILAEIKATEARLSLALALAEDTAKPYQPEDFDRHNNAPPKASKRLNLFFNPPPSRSSLICKHRDAVLFFNLRKAAAIREGVTALEFEQMNGTPSDLRKKLDAELKGQGLPAATTEEISRAFDEVDTVSPPAKKAA